MVFDRFISSVKQGLTIAGSDKRIAILLYFFINTLIVVCIYVYVNALFLSSYSRTWLPYFFIGQAIIDFGAATAAASFLSRNPLKGSVILQLNIILIIFLCMLALPWHFFLLPIIFSFFLMAMGSLFGVLAWNNIRAAVDMIELKQLSNLIITAGSIGNIVAGFFASFLVKQFNITILLPLLIFLIFLQIILLYQLKPLPTAVERLTYGIKPFKYPLFKQIFVIIFIITVTYTLAEYCLKLELATFQAQKIGKFIGIFTGICGTVSLVIGYFGTKEVLNRYGVIGLLAVLPLYWLLTSVSVVLLPMLWTTAIMAGGKYVLYYSIFSMGRELVLNILPLQIKITAQLLLKSVGSSVAGGITAIILLLVSAHLGLSTIAAIIFLLNLFLLFYIFNFRKSYITTLKEAVLLKRFTAQQINNKEEQHVVQEIATQALNSNDIEMVRFGFILLSTPNLFIDPFIIVKHLHSENTDIRIYAIKNITEYKMISVLPQLSECLSHEQDPEVTWYVFNAFATLNPNVILPQAKQWISHANALLRAGAVRLLLATKNSEDKILAMSTLTAMITHPDSAMRSGAIRVLAYLPVNQFNKELVQLIEDQNDGVRINAINVAASKRIEEFAEVIIENLKGGTLFYEATHALHQLGPKLILLIEKNIRMSKESQQRMLIKVLATFPDPAVETVLLRLADKKNTMVRYWIAREMANRGRHWGRSSEVRYTILDKIMYQCKLIYLFNFLKKQYKTGPVYNEVKSRKYLAKKQLLYWLAAYTNSQEVMNLMPTLLLGFKTDRAKAIELLDNLLHQHEMIELMANVFLKKIVADEAIVRDQEDYLDSWLQHVININKGNVAEDVMDQMQKVFILRKVELFKNLPGETLLVIANETETRDMIAEQTLFTMGDPPTGLFIIASGTVEIIKQNKVISRLKPNGFFGELALLDNAKRSATAIAKTEGVLLYLDKETFKRMTDELPQVLRAVVQVVLHYLRKYL